MSTEKIVLGHCEKTGKKFGIEVRKDGAEYRAVNFVELKESEYAGLSSEIAVNGLQSGSNLLACKKCSSLKVAGCSCNRRCKSCKSTDEYDFQCMYCDSFIIDRPKTAERKIYVTSKC